MNVEHRRNTSKQLPRLWQNHEVSFSNGIVREFMRPSINTVTYSCTVD
jgi:hypothetical protein